ncbi:MAG TPA: helix-turn-helix transcriptional regulator [bacterium]|nr:helix-turn-helix transcriptional regulator [bacterium]
MASVPLWLAHRVRQARLKAGLTQVQLAGKEVAARTISRIERGYVRPSVRVLSHIAQRVGRPLRYFVDDAMLDESEVDYLLARAGLRQLAGDRESAERLAASAVDLATATGDQARLALARLELLSIRVSVRRSPEVEAELASAQVEAARFGHAEAVARSYLAVAATLENDGLDARAQAALDAGLGVLDGRWPEIGVLFVAALIRLAATSSGDVRTLGRRLNALGRACDARSIVDAYETRAERAHASGDTRQALEAARHALAFRRAIAAKADEAGARYQLAHLARRSGRVDEAAAELTTACALARDAGDHLTEVQSLISLCGLHTAAGRAGQATQALEEARAAFLRMAEVGLLRYGTLRRATSGLEPGRMHLDAEATAVADKNGGARVTAGWLDAPPDDPGTQRRS